MGGCLESHPRCVCVCATPCGRVAFFPLFCCCFFYSWRLHINFVYKVRARVLMAEPLLGIGESASVCVCVCLTVAR